MIGFSVLAVAPDMDVFIVALGVPDHGAFGHRGLTHSLAFAALLGVLVAALGRRLGVRGCYTGLIAFFVVASHGVLDALTHESRGAPLFWPFSEERIVSPWRPIPVAPTGLRFLSVRGCEVAFVELIYFLPLIGSSLWPGSRARIEATFRRAALTCAALVFAVGSCMVLAELVLRDTWMVSRLRSESGVAFKGAQRHGPSPNGNRASPLRSMSSASR